MPTTSSFRPPGVWRELLGQAGPLLLASGLQLTNLVVDRAWVGRCGEESLAAVGAAQAVLALLTTGFLGLGMGTLAGVARGVGAGRPHEAARQLGQGLLLALGLAGLVSLSALVLPGAVLRWQQAHPQLAAEAAGYLRVGLLGAPLQATLLVLAFALQGAGQARAALRVQILSPLVNLLLDPLLVVAAGLGAPGAAWATLLANGVAVLGAARVLRASRPLLPLDAGCFAPRAALLRAIGAQGASGALEHLTRNGAALALVALLTPLGAHVLSAWTAVGALLLVLVFPGLALGQAAASLVGRSLGAGRPERAREAAWSAALAYALALALAGLALSAAGPGLLGLFGAGPRAVAEGAALLDRLAPALPFLGLALILGKVMSGAGRPLLPLGAVVLGHVVVQLPLVALLAHQGGARAAWLGVALAFVVQGALLSALVARHLGGPPLPRWRPLLAALPRPSARALPALVRLSPLWLLLCGCQAVDFTERRHLGDPIMALEDGPAETHLQQKTRYSREGSAGGIGGSAGGGCGCY